MYKILKNKKKAKYDILSDSEQYCEGKLKRRQMRIYCETDHEIFIL